MKTVIVYDPDCPKLKPDAYSQSYRDMFLALVDKFDAELVTESGRVDADVLIYYDIHSSHHVDIETDCDLIYEYFNDPWQKEFKGQYKDGTKVHKLSPKQRTIRAKLRGVKYIICPYTNLYYKYIYPYADDMELVWFPIAPNIDRFGTRDILLKDRKQEVLLNGHTWEGEYGFRPYHFRRWAYQQAVTKKDHAVLGSDTPAGMYYPDFLSQFAGSMALCDTHTVPKYSEIPLAGCVTFAQYQYDYEQMGFKDGESCIYVTKSNFERKINDFKNSVEEYQCVADAGRKLMEEKWTSKHFADYIYNHAKERL